ncbi:MAG: Smr/MutS family protein [candidate division KSB1 bacterium]|nr:Smr/MutS family protein [candidate division KSB1 bacterium]MDZ7335708.1 Smr/MutS family protein [candidate division KSB1 bacterium]MDZ7358551.1 Smr/MutS family protein [candidate division KSB1 bacterium]MDZ7401641.1 Smr/MutS family protein [candidate division KSB1 bacterium]
MGQKNDNIKPSDKPEELDEALPESIEVTDVLDLHGFFPEQVPEIVIDFIQNALELQLYRLRIIHGKGKSRLKWEVYQILKQHPQVAWFGDAPPEIGGWGATIVELKPPSAK